ncbi:MAG: aminotransferase class I/II-fold pyridoxal phosphate-dependent enzyme [Flavobacterium sp.]
MRTTRRLLLQQIGFGLAGIGLGNMKVFADPARQSIVDDQGTADNPIHLSSNENAYGPSPAARKVFAGNPAISNRYNWDIASQLITVIANKNNVHDENILLGAGSTELLDLVAKYATSQTGSYIIADPSYYYWTIPLDKLGLQKIKVPLTTDKKIDLVAMLQAIRPDTRLIYICNPNNPTGTICERQALIDFVNNVPEHVIMLIDEAYLEFTKQQSLSSLIHKKPNLVIVKTFSKIYGLAGARIGYALAGKSTIDKLGDLQSSPNSNVSVLSRLAAIASLKDETFVSGCYSLNETVRQFAIGELKKLNCDCIPSDTNFI